MNTPALSDLSSESSLYVLFIWCLVTDNIQQDAIIYPANSTVRLQCSRHGFVRNTGTRWGRVGRAPTGRLETLEALAESPITVPCPCPAGPRGITSETSESRSPFWLLPPSGLGSGGGAAMPPRPRRAFAFAGRARARSEVAGGVEKNRGAPRRAVEGDAG